MQQQAKRFKQKCNQLLVYVHTHACTHVVLNTHACVPCCRLDNALARCVLCNHKVKCSRNRNARRLARKPNQRAYSKTQRYAYACLHIRARSHTACLHALKQNQQISISKTISVCLRLVAVIYSGISTHKSRCNLYTYTHF